MPWYWARNLATACAQPSPATSRGPTRSLSSNGVVARSSCASKSGSLASGSTGCRHKKKDPGTLQSPGRFVSTRWGACGYSSAASSKPPVRSVRYRTHVGSASGAIPARSAFRTVRAASWLRRYRTPGRHPPASRTSPWRRRRPRRVSPSPPSSQLQRSRRLRSHWQRRSFA